MLESKWGIFDRYSFCCPSCPGCPRTVTRPLKSAPRRRHRPTAQPLRATSSLPRARYRSKPLNSAPRHRCRSTAQVCATSSLPLNRRDFLRRGFLRRDLGGAISPFTFHLSLLLSHFTSIRQIRQFLRDIHTYIHRRHLFMLRAGVSFILQAHQNIQFRAIRTSGNSTCTLNRDLYTV